MNVLVLHSQVPFVRGGAEVLIDGLVTALRDREHTVDTVALPLTWNPVEELLTSALAWRLLDTREFNGVQVDRVICTKYPTWAVDHPNKSLWLIHQHRQAYDLYGTKMSEFNPELNEESIRRRVVDIDRIGIGSCDRRFAISRNVSHRLEKYCGLSAETLYPPVPFDQLSPRSYEPFILSVGRLDPLKRVSPLIDAWKHVDGSLKLMIVGDGPDRKQLEQRAVRTGVSDRIEFTGRVSDTQLQELYSRCRAVYYAPLDEDYGYVTVEALMAGKPVVTAPDSGGVLEFVKHGQTGLITVLTPQKVAEAINLLVDEARARELGRSGPDLTRTIGWDLVVDSLLGPG